VTGLDAGNSQVVVSELREDTFYAVIWVERNGELISWTRVRRMHWPWRCGRLSDHVDDSVLKSSKATSAVADKVNANQELKRWLENLNEEDLGRYKM